VSISIEIPTTVYCNSRTDGPIDARLGLGDPISVRNGELSTEIPTSEIFDVRTGPPPKAAANVFTGTVLIIGFEGTRGREVLFVDGKEGTLDKIAGLLYRQLLHGIDVAVSHPSKIGGRVTDKSFEIGKLLVTPGLVGCGSVNEPLSVDLDRIVDFSRSTETLLGERRPVVDIKYVRRGVAVSLKLSLASNRKQHLLGLFLRREYDELREQLRGIDLAAPAIRALVKLYSARGTAALPSLLEDAESSSASIVRELEEAGLIEANGERALLTRHGWFLVNNYVGTRDADAVEP